MKKSQEKIYDLIIIGAGPAGLTAGLFAGRYKMKTLIIGKVLGGTPLEAHLVENWPGIKSISGFDLSKKMIEQVKALDSVEIINKEITGIKKKNDFFELYTLESNPDADAGADHGLRWYAKTLILAMGNRPRKLEIPGEKEFLGKGVSYCVTCDGPLFQDKTVAVIGGGNSACTGAIPLSEYAKKIYLIYRKGCLRADEMVKEKIEKNPKIEIIYNTNVLEILGNDSVESVKLDNPYNNKNTLAVQGVFVEIGSVPNIALCKNLGVELDEMDQIKVDIRANYATNIPGVFGAGDITNATNMRQIITACAEGAVSARGAYDFLN